MGIYLGLVEDDDARGYGRYDARQSDHPEDRRYGRYASEDRFAGDYDGRYESDYAAGGYDDDHEAEELAPVRDPEPLAVRRVVPARPVGLASAGAGASRIGAVSGGSVGASAASLAVREQAVREQAAPAPEPAPAPAPAPYRIITLHPRTYNEARTIGERFRDGMPVIMNLTELDHSDARRLVDFAAGLIFGLRGSIEPVTAKVFLLSPPNVDVTAEDKARIREGGFFNQS
jgi:cell division inhibitor SepF